jgi:hypothetical protein
MMIDFPMGVDFIRGYLQMVKMSITRQSTTFSCARLRAQQGAGHVT